ncbi:MAG: TDP-N-acetylfucosamine:lipid II N-acetylfucosaminyltransferase [Thiohalorhabdus sp.]
MPEKLKIAHIAPDEKFIDSAYCQFEEAVPSSNTVFVPTEEKRFRYIKKAPARAISPYRFKDPFFTRSLKGYDLVVLHSLNKFNQEVIAHAPQRTKFSWMGMGFDYYDIIFEDKRHFLMEDTLEIFEYCQNRKRAPKDSRSGLMDRITQKNRRKSDLAKKVRYFAPVLKREHEIIAHKLNSEGPEFVDWRYSLNSGFFEEIENHKNTTGKDILLGNSASFSNNHIEAFKLIESLPHAERRIICPLSYGNPCYASWVMEDGRQRFGDNFTPLRLFLPPEEYLEKIRSCSNIIMNHIRQQAAGNISLMLFMGAKVFLHNRNPLYRFYRDLNLPVYSLDELSRDPALLDLELPREVTLQTRRILRDQLGWQAAVQRTSNLIEKATGYRPPEPPGG